jgi:hypothetical protein
MLMAHYICTSDGAQDVALRLQRPTLVAEVAFMAAMLQFVMPSIALGADPTPFLRHDFQCVLHLVLISLLSLSTVVHISPIFHNLSLGCSLQVELVGAGNDVCCSHLPCQPLFFRLAFESHFIHRETNQVNPTRRPCTAGI